MPQIKKHTVVKSLKGMPERRLELRTYALRMRLSNSEFPLNFNILRPCRGAQKSLIGRRNVLIYPISYVLVSQRSYGYFPRSPDIGANLPREKPTILIRPRFKVGRAIDTLVSSKRTGQETKMVRTK